LASSASGSSCFFIVLLASLTLVMGTTIPTPLYSIYRAEFNLTPILITVIYAAYALVVFPALFIFGPMGDKYGRKPVLLSATLVGMAAILSLSFAVDLTWLIIGRILQGIAIGIALGNATAALVEFEPNKDRKKANRAAGTSLFTGLLFGPLIGGLLGQYSPMPLLLPYLVNLALLIVSFLLLLTIKEEHQKPPNAPLFYKPTVPSGKGAVFFSSAIAGGLVFAMSGLYFSLAPTYVEANLGINNVAVGGLVVSVMVLVATVVQFFGASMGSKRLMSIGEVCLIAGLALLVLSQVIVSIVVLIIGAVVSGVGYGAAFHGAVATVNAIAPKDQRGNVTSSFYAICYLLLTFPTIGIGFVAQEANLSFAIAFFSLIVIIVTVIHLVWVAAKAKSIEFG
jgi:MFS family permease